MKFLTRLLPLLLALVLCLGSVATAELDYSTTEPLFLSVFDYPASEWYSGEFNRSLLATCAMIDAVLVDNEQWTGIIKDALSANTIYVARTDDMLLVFFFAKTEMLVAYYTPSVTLFSLSQMDITSTTTPATRMAGYKSNGIIQSYYAVSTSDIMEVYEMIMGALNGE